MKLLIKISLLVFIPFFLIYIYKNLICSFNTDNFPVGIICRSGWKFGFIICLIFSLYSLFQIVFMFPYNLIEKWLWILGIYIFGLGIFAFPYMLVSFVNIEFSGFLHFLPILFSLDLLSKRIEKA